MRRGASRRQPLSVDSAHIATGRPAQKAVHFALTCEHDATNLADFTNNMDTHARSNFPQLYQIVLNPDADIGDSEPDTIEEISARVTAENLSHNIEKALLSERSRRLSDIRDMRKEGITMYGDLFSRLSPSSEHRVKCDPEYTDFHRTCDVRKLWKSIIKTHAVGYDASDTTAPRLVEEELEKTRQKPDQSVLDFVKVFNEKTAAVDSVHRTKLARRIEDAYQTALEKLPIPDLSRTAAQRQNAATEVAAERTYLDRKRRDDLKAAREDKSKTDSELGELLISKLDPNRFGDLHRSLVNDETLGKPSMPRTVNEALTVARKWKITPSRNGFPAATVLTALADETRPAARSRTKKQTTPRSFVTLAAAPAVKKTSVTCYYCGKGGHRQHECDSKARGLPKKYTPPQVAAPPIPKCTICYRSGHLAEQCFAKTKAPPKTQFTAIADVESEEGEKARFYALVARPYITHPDDDTDIPSPMHHSGTDYDDDESQHHITHRSHKPETAQTVHLSTSVSYAALDAGIPDYMVILDTGSIGNIIKSRRLITDLYIGPTTRVVGINGTGIVLNQYGTAGHWGKALYNPTGLANVLSMNSIGPSDRVTYNTAPSPHFEVRWADGHTQIFKKQTDSRLRGLYCLDTRYPGGGAESVTLVTEAIDTPATANFSTDTAGIVPPSTSSERASGYTKREVKQAAVAREYLSRMLITPRELALAVRKGTYLNAPFVASDVERSISIWGTPLEKLKGTTTVQQAQKSRHVEPTHLPQELRTSPEIYGDVLYICRQPFLLMCIEPIGMCVTYFLKDQKGETIAKHIVTALLDCRARGIEVHRMYTDSAAGLVAAQEHVAHLHLRVSEVGAGVHVSKAERDIRTLKEAMRGVITGTLIPHHIDQLILTWLVRACALMLNCRRSTTLADGTPPIEYWINRKVDLKIDFRTRVLTYAQVTEPPKTLSDKKKVTIPRTKGMLILAPVMNLAGSVHALNLLSWKVVSRTHFTELPMSDEVITHINDRIASSGKRVCGGDGTTPRDLPPDVTEDDDPNDTPESDSNEEVQALPTPYDAPAPATPMPHPSEHSPEDPNPGRSLTLDPGDQYDQDLPFGENDGRGSFSEGLEAAHLPPEEGAVQTDDPDMPALASTLKYKAGVTEHGEAPSKAAAHAEMAQLVEKKVFAPVHPSSLTPEERKACIPSSMNLKAKYDAANQFEKLKARLVAGGHRQHRGSYDEDETAAPTCTMSSIFMLAALASRTGEHVIGIDVPGAYLNATPSKKIHMRLDRDMTAMYVELVPSAHDMVNAEGCVIVRLLKALYGCVESAMLWYEHLRSFLASIGFEHCPHDPCMFKRGAGEHMVRMVVYVDDLLISCKLNSVLLIP